MEPYEVCIVGAGLIGSATAKYLAKNRARTCLIGPTKPADNDTAQDVFDSWGDISRISHTLFPDILWARLAIESIKRYRSLEQESGVQFFTDTGYLVLSDSQAYIKENADVARHVGVTNVDFYNNKTELEKRFPVLQFPADAKLFGVAEPKNAGLINPTKLVEAQRILFAKYGGTFMDDFVIKIERKSEGTSFKLNTKSGSIVQANNVLVCAGSFLSHHKLLPDHCRLALSYRPALLIRTRIEAGPVLDSLLKCPPLILTYASPATEGKINGSSIYTASPILYPDGHYYLKIGYLDDTSKFENRVVDSPQVVTDVYRADPATNEEIQANGRHLISIAKSLFKGLQGDTFISKTCCYARTPTSRPYLGSVAPNWFVVTGDNGFAAKSSDEIGRLASELILNGKWFDYSEDDFRVQILPNIQ